MTSPSPSEFLTFMRYAARSTRSLRAVSRPRIISPASISARPLSVSAVRLGTGKSSTDDSVATDGKHDPDKRDPHEQRTDVQGVAAKIAKEERAKGDTAGGQAIHRRDERGSVKKTQEEFPEAPSPAIGMQDERGRKGH